MTGKLCLHKVRSTRYMQFVTTSNILNPHLPELCFIIAFLAKDVPVEESNYKI